MCTQALYADLERVARFHFADALGLGVPRWLHAPVLAGLGPMFQVPGAPRCFVSAARSVSALAIARNDFWGPSEARIESRVFLDQLFDWAHTFPTGGSRPRDRSTVMFPTRAARLVRKFREGSLPPTSPLFGQALYVASWAAANLVPARRWLRDHSLDRSWAPGHDREWDMLAGATSFTAAFHVLRFLCNGLPGRARHRPDHLRLPPQLCTRCGQPSTHVRITHSALGPGVE